MLNVSRKPKSHRTVLARDCRVGGVVLRPYVPHGMKRIGLGRYRAAAIEPVADPVAVPPAEITPAEEETPDTVIEDSEDEVGSPPDSDASEDRFASCEATGNEVIIPATEGFANPADSDMAGDSGFWTTVSQKRPASSVTVSVKRTQQAPSKSAAVSPMSDIRNGGPNVFLEVPELAACSADHRAILWEIAVDTRKPVDQRKRFCRWTSDLRFIGLRDEDFKTAMEFCRKKFPNQEASPPPPQFTNIVVSWYPYEWPNDAVATALSGYGVVKSVRHQVWPGLPDVSTGSRIVSMVRTKEIPRFVSIKGVRCKVWYRGQPLRCDICRAIGHKSAACPDRGRCLRCHKEGHFARTCPDAWNKASAPTVPSVAAPGDEAVQPLDSDVVVPPPPAGSVDEVSALSASDVNVADPTPPEPVDTAMECGDVFPPASQGPLDSQGYLNEDVVDPIVVVSGQGASVPSSDIDSSESGVKLYDEHFSQLDEVASVTSSVVQGILSNGDILSDQK
ncbi:hypothetical protein AWC38_SpisGene21340 [Stylophora pistillata]|uniref:CCHC-type domain-containing protein n=1 Tax=Stylophora pistillata TaxID=50429 RepID=A0A2B4RDQ2_STYPI|nr:hypothetical protein AWC38_SpisGene21340 [Stylophora pistillata]